MTKQIVFAGVLATASALTACSGGGSNSAATTPPAIAPSTPAPTLAPTLVPQSQQVVSVALPTTAIGQQTDPVFGLIGGYTQRTYSQILGFAPGMQIMIRNADSLRPHTLGDLKTTSFPANDGGVLSTTATASSTFSSGWQSGNLTSGQLVGPITLMAGTYYIGCAYHYESNHMRDVLVVASGATPGPEATQQPGAPTPSPTNAPGGTSY